MAEIFKTNIMNEEAAENVLLELQQIFPGSRILFDLEDCDKILKIVSDKIICVDTLISTINNFGYNIEVLE